MDIVREYLIRLKMLNDLKLKKASSIPFELKHDGKN